MSYYEWAKANPEKTTGYKRLIRALELYNVDIAKHRQELEDARNGVLPERETSTLLSIPLRSPYSKLLESIPVVYSDWTPREPTEDETIKHKKEEYKRSLEVAIRVAEMMLESANNGKQRVEMEIKNYSPRNVGWRGVDLDFPLEYANTLQSAINDRLFVIGYTERDYAVDNIGDFCDGQNLSAHIQMVREGWIARVGRGNIFFTRFAYGMETAFAIAALTYIDHQWDKLISVYENA